MCLIIWKDKGIESVNPDIFTEAYNFNDDGFGLMFPLDGRVEFDRSIGDIKIIQSLVEAYTTADLPIAYHMRYGTHGKMNTDNCHPFQVLSLDEDGHDLYLMHNGVLSSVYCWDKDMSDTWHFVEDWLKPLLKEEYSLIKKDWFRDFVGFAIGFGNKLFLMDGDGDHYIINEDSGLWTHENLWLSNDSYTYSHEHPDKRRKHAKGRWPTWYTETDYDDYYELGYRTGGDVISKPYNSSWWDDDENNDGVPFDTSVPSDDELKTYIIGSEDNDPVDDIGEHLRLPPINYASWNHVTDADLYAMGRNEVERIMKENPDILLDWVFTTLYSKD